jgi:hypothetical protein
MSTAESFDPSKTPVYGHVRKVYALMDRCQMGTAKIAGALAKAIPNMEPLVRNRSSHFAKKGADGKPVKDYADLAQCHKAASKALAEQGLVVVQTLTNNTDGEVVLCTQLLHSSGEYIDSNLPIKATSADPQRLAAAITYARRAAYCALVGLAADDDDDGTTAEDLAKEAAASSEKRIVDMAIKSLNEATNAERRQQILDKVTEYVKTGVVRQSAYEDLKSMVDDANKSARTRREKAEAAS